jgi:isopenicillin N synthase-like dioxygenase
MLFHVVGGLQILPPGSENINANWQYVRPVPGCALVNLGDTIVEWTGGVLRSCLHRVAVAPGTQGSVPRLSLGYFVRPKFATTMRRLTGGAIPPLADGEVEDTRSVTE